MKKMKASTTKVSGDTKTKSMILSLDPAIHAWIKNIAETTGKAQPKIVQMVLAKEANKPPEAYINQILEVEKKARAEQIKEQMNLMSKELQKLEEDIS